MTRWYLSYSVRKMGTAIGEALKQNRTLQSLTLEGGIDDPAPPARQPQPARAGAPPNLRPSIIAVPVRLLRIAATAGERQQNRVPRSSVRPLRYVILRTKMGIPAGSRYATRAAERCK